MRIHGFTDIFAKPFQGWLDGHYSEVEDSYNSITESTNAVSISKEDFTRYYAVFLTRAIQLTELNDEHVIIPIYDLWNHAPKPNCEVEIVRNEDMGYSVSILATSSISAGHELFLNYGTGKGMPTRKSS